MSEFDRVPMNITTAAVVAVAAASMFVLILLNLVLLLDWVFNDTGNGPNTNWGHLDSNCAKTIRVFRCSSRSSAAMGGRCDF